MPRAKKQAAKPKPTGRPTKLTPQTVDDFTQALRAGAAWKHAAEYAGIDESLAHRWRKRGEDAVAERETRSEMTVAQLREVAKDRKLEMKPRATKAQLIKALEEHEEPFVDFLQQATRARAEKRLTLLLKIKAATDTDWRAAKWMLAVDDPQSYGEKHISEISGPEGGPIETVEAESPREKIRGRLVAIADRQRQAADEEPETAETA